MSGLIERPTRFEELPGLCATVDRVEFVPNASVLSDRPYQFNYFVTIHNRSARPVVILGRKWIVTDRAGHKLIVEGDGVVGQFPRLSPGDRFRYNSYHLLATDSRAEGAYLGRDDDGNGILIKIPSFEMRIPPTIKQE